MAAITLRRVTKSFGPVHVIKGVDLEIEPNEFVVFVGPSGCGKSTLLRLIAGLEDITSGELMIDEEIVNDLPPAERHIAMVFQSYALYPHMSVYDNMAFGLKLAKLDREAADARVRNAARILQIEHLLDRKPRQLSGGQRQRVAIGRAIVRDPKVFLFDEPLSNLDAALRVQMRVEIAKLHQELDATMVYVTHDQVEAMTLADRIVVLDAGRVQQFGAPLELYQHPRNRFVAGFIGSPKMNFLPCTPAGTENGTLRLALSDGTILPLPSDLHRTDVPPAEIGIRPEHLRADGSGDAALPGRAITVERLGAESYLYVDTGAPEPLVVKTEAASPIRAGDMVRIGIPAPACYLFAADGTCIERQPFH
ncbi:ABC transporter ATP-binding protein [Benzoatithermus flavus]|uniref:Sn-glycerol-3-phosphate ABC transporter ATP-binding protein UgpC n=1 Tax=Benzoatithermus flavus TaxID=3108223 RepID=A0ABU8XZ27_9PROT